MALYLIEWTHGDGMDQHEEAAELTGTQANSILNLLHEREAIDPHVYEPMVTIGFDELVEKIKEDLPLADES